MLIGISGKIGSGKTTVADLIVKHRPNFEKRAYADNSKLVTSIISGIELPHMYTHEGKAMFVEAFGMTVGEMQQKIGTNAIRNNVHKDSWVLSLFSQWLPESDWIVGDVRYPNEAQAILDRHGLLIRVNGDPENLQKTTTRDMTHDSETALDNWTKWDYIINNTGTLEQLEQTVVKILNKHDHN
jgi:dephospho-CoA kinase